VNKRTLDQGPKIRLQRAYDAPGDNDGYRVLVDRFWPRGRSRDALQLNEWARELAPEPDLIKWFGHRPERWDEFRRRYRDWLEQAAQSELASALIEAAGGEVITLVYGARSETENQAIVIRELLLGHADAKHESAQENGK
jgi:uncharacterized protein YeaO (DUF488 family)